MSIDLEAADDRSKPARILFIEDDDEMRLAMTELLTAYGYDVCPCEDGFSGMEKVRTSAGFDVVVTDLRMPRLNGIQLLEIFRDEHPELSCRTIVISGFAPIDAPLPPHFVLLHKPVSSEDLCDAITACATRQNRAM